MEPRSALLAVIRGRPGIDPLTEAMAAPGPGPSEAGEASTVLPRG